MEPEMEKIMQLDESERFDPETGHPENKSYLECGLPPYLQKSIENMKRSWEIEDSGKQDMHWDRIISPEQAWYLRTKYLRMERE